MPYEDRLARLTAIRAYVRAQYLREDAHVNWDDIGAKVKKLIDERIDANVRQLMKPVSVLDDDFDQKISTLPHDEARASVMEHAIRAYISERLADNPAFYGKLSEQLERIISDLRNQVIDAAEAARRQAELKREPPNRGGRRGDTWPIAGVLCRLRIDPRWFVTRVAVRKHGRQWDSVPG